MLIHTVYFWLHEGTPAARLDGLIKDCYEILGRCPTVKQIYAGKPAATKRDVVDSSYQVSITVLFEDLAAQDAYQVEPIHFEFIAKNKDIWKKVQVYDMQTAK